MSDQRLIPYLVFGAEASCTRRAGHALSGSTSASHPASAQGALPTTRSGTADGSKTRERTCDREPPPGGLPLPTPFRASASHAPDRGSEPLGAWHTRRLRHFRRKEGADNCICRCLELPPVNLGFPAIVARWNPTLPTLRKADRAVLI